MTPGLVFRLVQSEYHSGGCVCLNFGAAELAQYPTDRDEVCFKRRVSWRSITLGNITFSSDEDFRVKIAIFDFLLRSKILPTHNFSNFAPIWFKFGLDTAGVSRITGGYDRTRWRRPRPTHRPLNLRPRPGRSGKKCRERRVRRSGPVTSPRNGALCVLLCVKISCESVDICRSYSCFVTP